MIDKESHLDKLINTYTQDVPFGICMQEEDGQILYQNDVSQNVCGSRTGKACNLCDDTSNHGPLVFQKNTQVSNKEGSAVTFFTGKIQTKIFLLSTEKIAILSQKLDRISLTKTERKIAELILQNHTNAEILNKLNIQKSTLKTHLNHLYQKAPFLKENR